MLRFLLKIWPAFVPIALYLLWASVIKKYLPKQNTKENIIEGELVDEGKKDKKVISLENKFFVIAIYASLILAIITLILSAFSA